MLAKAKLGQLRELIRDYYGTRDAVHRGDVAAQIVDRIETIDRWMTGGGFSPWAGAVQEGTSDIAERERSDAVREEVLASPKWTTPW